MPLSMYMSKKVVQHFQGRFGTYQSKRLHAAVAAALTVKCLTPTSPFKGHQQQNLTGGDTEATNGVSLFRTLTTKTGRTGPTGQAVPRLIHNQLKNCIFSSAKCSSYCSFHTGEKTFRKKGINNKEWWLNIFLFLCTERSYIFSKCRAMQSWPFFLLYLLT